MNSTNPGEDPFFQRCSKAFKANPPAKDTYKECCKIVQALVEGFMNEESVRFLAVWGWPVLENVDINEIYVQKDHWLLKY